MSNTALFDGLTKGLMACSERIMGKTVDVTTEIPIKVAVTKMNIKRAQEGIHFQLV